MNMHTCNEQHTIMAAATNILQNGLTNKFDLPVEEKRRYILAGFPFNCRNQGFSYCCSTVSTADGDPGIPFLIDFGFLVPFKDSLTKRADNRLHFN